MQTELKMTKKQALIAEALRSLTLHDTQHGMVMCEYKIEHGGGNHVFISRTYGKPEYSAKRHEAYSIGPHGGVRTIYKSFY